MSNYSRRQVLQASVAAALGTSGLGGSVASARLDAPQAEPSKAEPPIKVRMFWVWDHSTEWALNHAGAKTIGSSETYGRNTPIFVQDITALLEWCGRHHVDAVTVWGLLRDAHGGLESVKKLCDVAAKNEVRLMVGMGLNSYGGVYYEGSSPYNLEQHLAEHPDLYAVDSAGNKIMLKGPHLTYHACPSRPENQEFAAESLRWLFNNVPLGGVQLESGDTGICQCAHCLKRRQLPGGQFSWEDMSLMYPIAAEAVRSVSSEAWIDCETYSHPEPYAGSDPAPRFGDGKPAWADACLAKFPKGKGIFVGWVGDSYIKPRLRSTWTSAGTVSNDSRQNVMRAHLGSYWTGRIRGELSIDWIADMVQRSLDHGIDGINLFGEVSPFDTGAELNYLALETFGSAANPKADLDVFLRDVAAPLLGGEQNAHDYLRYARLLDDRTKIPHALKEIYARCGSMEPDAARRWAWLGNFLASFVY